MMLNFCPPPTGHRPATVAAQPLDDHLRLLLLWSIDLHETRPWFSFGIIRKFGAFGVLMLWSRQKSWIAQTSFAPSRSPDCIWIADECSLTLGFWNENIPDFGAGILTLSA